MMHLNSHPYVHGPFKYAIHDGNVREQMRPLSLQVSPPSLQQMRSFGICVPDLIMGLVCVAPASAARGCDTGTVLSGCKEHLP